MSNFYCTGCPFYKTKRTKWSSDGKAGYCSNPSKPTNTNKNDTAIGAATKWCKENDMKTTTNTGETK
jgi:hypothetical protein